MIDFVKKHQEKINLASFQLSNQAIYWLNKEGRILYANDNALDVLGYSLDELQEKYVWDIDAIVDTKKKYLEAVRSFQQERPDGSPNVIESYHKKKKW